MTEIVIPYEPRPLQGLFHDRRARFSVAVCHRRFGKTVMAVCELLKRMLECGERNPQGAYLATTYGQAKRVAWEYLKLYAGVLPGFKANEAELRVEFTTATGVARIWCLGSENYNNIRGMYLDYVVLDEYADMPAPLLNEVVRPALADRRGGYLIIGTPRGHNIFFDIYDLARRKAESGDLSYHAVVYPASETGILPAEELDAMRSAMTEEEYEQELECSFEAAIRGAYYGKLLEGVAPIEMPARPEIRVETGWDLGMTDSTAVWFFQRTRFDCAVVDYYEASGEALHHYVKVLEERGYIYGRHYLPHDVMVADLGTGKSRYEMLRQMGVRPTVAAKLPVMDGIAAVRKLLPTCYWANNDAVAKGLNAMRQYRAQWDEKGQRWRSQPLHDWTSHAADAFRTYAVGIRDGEASATGLDGVRMPTVRTDYVEF